MLKMIDIVTEKTEIKETKKTEKVVRTGVRLLEWDSVAHCIKIKRPAHLSIVERLGGFWWCKCTAFILNSQTFLKKKAVRTSF